MPDPRRPIIDEKPGLRFGREIREAVSAGAELADMQLNLTLMDASKIKRDRDIALSDVSFADGRMRYLGVNVVEGGARSSALFTTAEEAAAGRPEPEPVVEAAKGQKKSNKEVRKPKAEKAKPAPAGKTFTTPPPK